ncbi:hypothetical protein R2360_16645 [Mycobacteroides chelonae]|uniref:Uncharacterized protein n=1 Tax=Mycobacteroides chelonae TaxID=1774 RepID=A0AB73U470_MYCCH|nr:hypothetical protein [Mycobacteroides chelonae]MBF9319424.1 hypothetical protein [Mycobacteroides chelonae]MEC4841075.1 hypothetical protein [Mycobacteroides chelonae]MEC4842794.1 hypothetical protein [Mycobacteroides chelonae]OHT70713.1 hypothetical protein BKG66_16490 [Mycobacteroides chelonae]OHT71642.1 hypothetical protein BKG67_17045 [Mycobacteroides chelonae]
MTSPLEISISLGGLADFVTARSSRRIAVVRDVIDMYESEYDPSHDFYKQVREALRDGIPGGDDVRRVRAAVEAAHARRRRNYGEIADGWESWRQRKDLVLQPQSRKWREQELEVSVSPLFIWRHGRQRELVWVYYKDAELSVEAAQAVTRILELTYGWEFGTPAALDIRRSQLHRARRRRPRDYDRWLEGEVSAFLRMFRSLGPAA